MSTENDFKECLKRYEKDPDFILEGLLMDLNEQVLELLEAKGMSITKFAEVLGKPVDYVYEFLNCNVNPTLKMLIKIALVLESKLDVSIGEQYNINKVVNNIRKYFEELRFDENHHLGLGDIRLTIAQQNEILDILEELVKGEKI